MERGCLACELTSGARALPGGPVHETALWRVEHCVGPLGVGTLVVKPCRHVLHVAELSAEEAAELGPLLRGTAAVVTRLSRPQEVYVDLWSSGPVHIHWVVQPVSTDQIARAGVRGPWLQVRMFEQGQAPDPAAAADYAERARAAWGQRGGADQSRT
jgi:diadenosine tetraphosphate (Ap4A) HIT family hydrolase